MKKDILYKISDDAYFYLLDIQTEFDQFFHDMYIEWEEDWVRKREYIGTEFYKIVQNLDTWKQYYLHSKVKFLIYNYKGIDTGVIAYEDNEEEVLIEELLVKKIYRGIGHGSEIVNNFLKYLEYVEMVKRIVVSTNESNISNKIYQKYGFVLLHLIKNDRENGENTAFYIKENHEGGSK